MRNAVVVGLRVQSQHENLLTDWARWQRSGGCTERTIAERDRFLRSFARQSGSDLLMACSDDIVCFLAECRERGNTKSTVANYFSHLKAWFVWLVHEQHRVDNPCARVKPPKPQRTQPRPISDMQLGRILNTSMHRRTRMMVLLAAFQGLRVHEIAKIRGEDVDLFAGTLRVIGKQEVDALLPLHRYVAEAAEGFARRGFWFGTYIGNRASATGPILSHSVSQIVGNAMRRAGVYGGPHRLRHWFASDLVARGVNIRIVQELMRHASLQSTQIYTRVTFQQQEAALAMVHLAGFPGLADHTAAAA